jgi:hypothetical protein
MKLRGGVRQCEQLNERYLHGDNEEDDIRARVVGGHCSRWGVVGWREERRSESYEVMDIRQ